MHKCIIGAATYRIEYCIYSVCALSCCALGDCRRRIRIEKGRQLNFSLFQQHIYRQHIAVLDDCLLLDKIHELLILFVYYAQKEFEHSVNFYDCKTTDSP